LEHPCPNGCGHSWKLTAAEKDKVIDPDANHDPPQRRRGRADEVNGMGGDFVGRALESWGFKD
jgi:hypothetical protein